MVAVHSSSHSLATGKNGRLLMGCFIPLPLTSAVRGRPWACAGDGLGKKSSLEEGVCRVHATLGRAARDQPDARGAAGADK